MKKYRWVIPFIIILFSAIIAYQWGSIPMVQPQESSEFSAKRVLEDLKIIAQAPHSVAHPQERAAVRDYLVKRLRELGGAPMLYHYPNVKSRNFLFDAYNVFAEFPPLHPTTNTSYLLLVAHYDSCYPRKVRQQTETSLGAADDGYGLGIILECLQLALKQRTAWQQGIKILFTDAEEVDLIGMKIAYTQQRELFNNVGLVINLEARGTYGPALLFETSPGNKKLMELYGEQARYPYTYSLTNVVYRSMPNGTDFSVIRDSLPGFNFSTIADINHYHTSKDNLEEVTLSSIQHYGVQIFPIIMKYLTDSKFADKNYLKQQQDLIYFTLPVLGFFSFSKSGYLIFNLIFLLLFLIPLGYYLATHRFNWKRFFTGTVGIFLTSCIALGIGFLVTWLCCRWLGIHNFRFVRVLGAVPYDNLLMVGIILLLGISILGVCWKRSRLGTDHLFQLLCETLLLQLLFGTILLLTIGENMMFFLPFAATWLGVLGWRFTSSSFFLGISLCIVSLHAFSFLYVLIMALSIGTFGITLWLTFYDLLTLILLTLLFQCRTNKK